MNSTSSNSTSAFARLSAKRVLLLALGVLVFLRMATLDIPALVDSTEGRYASIAEFMESRGDWVTPLIPMDEGVVPYLGKPPLHFWVSAGVMAVFGPDEWSARLATFLGALLTMACVYILGVRFFDRATAIAACAILGSSGLFFFLSGVCHLDLTLTAAVTLAFTGAACTLLPEQQHVQRRWGYLFFVGLALGMLTKGPVAVVLVGGGLILWCLARRSLSRLSRLPWLGGVALFFLIAIPWFLLAERATPGFLYYFFVNENFLRYVTREYGDRYGSGHVFPYGSSWWMLFSGLLPWSIPIVLLAGALRRELVTILRAQPPAVLMLIGWGLFPPLFFTVARQLLPAYLLPGFPAIALLMAHCLLNPPATHTRLAAITFRSIVWFGALLSLAMVGVGLTLGASISASLLALLFGAAGVWLALKGDYASPPHRIAALVFACALSYTAALVQMQRYVTERRSTKAIIETVRREASEERPEVAVSFGNPFSAYFYAEADPKRRVTIVRVPVAELAQSSVRHLIVKRNDLSSLPSEVRSRFDVRAEVGRWRYLVRK